MKTIKTFLFDRFNVLFPLFALTVLSILMLAIRLKIIHSFFFLFLAWNLFLAMVPISISSCLVAAKKIKKPKLYFLLVIWLLFLPNAPYLLTDFIHLRLSPLEWLGFDGLMIAIFAITGITYYLFSVQDIEGILLKNFNHKIAKLVMATLPFLVSFGIYLGRVLRWNSWDILHNPLRIFIDVLALFTNPFENRGAWLFATLLGLFLKLVYWGFKKYLFNYRKA